MPTNHQELFNQAIAWKRTVNHELSTDISGSSKQLRAWAQEYGRLNNLQVPTDPSAFGIYYEDDESF